MKKVNDLILVSILLKNLAKHFNMLAIFSIFFFLGCGQKSSVENVDDNQYEQNEENQPFATVKLPTNRTNSEHWVLEVVSRNADVYRFKVADSLSELPCYLGSGYSDPIPIEDPINIDHSNMIDGEVKLCIIGGQGQNDWQPLHNATSVNWILDTSGPGDFIIDKAMFVDRMKLHIQFSLSQNAVNEYRVRFTRLKDSCDQYVHEAFIEKRYADIEISLPGGRYRICATAFDDLGNASEAKNSSSLEVEVPVDLHFSFYTRADGDDKELHYGRLDNISNNLWPVGISASERRHIVSGRVDILSAGQNGAIMVVPSHNYSIVGADDSKLSLAIIEKQGEAHHVVLDTGEGSHAIGQQLSGATDQNGGIHIVHAGWVNQRAYLGYIQAKGSDFSMIKTYDLPVEKDRYIQDLNVSLDQMDHLHIAYIQQGNLFYRSTKSNGFQEDSIAIDTSECDDVLFADIEVTEEGHPYIAFLCDKHDQESDKERCEFHVAKIDSSQAQLETEVIALEVVDPSRNCSPFNSMKPSIRIGSDGYLYGASVFYPSDDSESAAIVVTKMKLSGGETKILQEIKVDEAPLGFPQLELDANNRVYLSYIADETLMFTSQATSPSWTIRRLSGPTVNKRVITLSSMVIGGHNNRYRSSGGPSE